MSHPNATRLWTTIALPAINAWVLERQLTINSIRVLELGVREQYANIDQLGRMLVKEYGERFYTYAENDPHHPYSSGHVFQGKRVYNLIPGYKGEQTLLDAEDETFDLIFSLNTMEHVKRPWEWVTDQARVLAPGGMMVHIAPISWPYHDGGAGDYWRIYPDGMQELFIQAGLIPRHCTRSRSEGVSAEDTIGIAVKAAF